MMDRVPWKTVWYFFKRFSRKLSFYNWDNWISEKLNYLLKVNPASWWQSQDWNLDTHVVSARSVFNRTAVRQASPRQVMIHNFCIYFGSWICAVLFSVHFFLLGNIYLVNFLKNHYMPALWEEKKNLLHFFPHT